MRAQLEEWRALLTRQVQDGRTLLRQVLVGSLQFTQEDGVYRFEGEAAVGRLIAGTAGLEGLPTILASPMPASWNKIAGWLKQIDNLRQAA